jgi:perosamine synthetase
MIPVNEPLLDGNERAYLNECIDTGWISSEGPFIGRLESGFAELTGRRHAVAVTNGSAALDAAIAAIGIGHDDEVILPAFTIISCAAAIVRAGAVPVAIDSDPLTWNMDVARIEERITARTKAIMVVHIYGLPVDMDPVLDLARRHGLMVIEDAAEAIGLTYKGKQCGGFGDVSTFSFYPNKHVTTGEGGMVLANSDRFGERLRSLRNLCFQPARRFVHEELGWNLRMSNLQAAIGVAQLERLAATVARKRAIGRLYNDFLKDVGGIQLPVQMTDYADNIYWVFGVLLDDDVPFDAQGAMEKLRDLGIGTRPFFWPMTRQPVFESMGLFENNDCPVAERLGKRGFYLPSGLALTDAQIAQAAEAMASILR